MVDSESPMTADKSFRDIPSLSEARIVAFVRMTASLKTMRLIFSIIEVLQQRLTAKYSEEIDLAAISKRYAVNWESHCQAASIAGVTGGRKMGNALVVQRTIAQNTNFDPRSTICPHVNRSSAIFDSEPGCRYCSVCSGAGASAVNELARLALKAKNETARIAPGLHWRGE